MGKGNRKPQRPGHTHTSHTHALIHTEVEELGPCEIHVRTPRWLLTQYVLAATFFEGKPLPSGTRIAVRNEPSPPAIPPRKTNPFKTGRQLASGRIEVQAFRPQLGEAVDVPLHLPIWEGVAFGGSTHNHFWRLGVRNVATHLLLFGSEKKESV